MHYPLVLRTLANGINFHRLNRRFGDRLRLLHVIHMLDPAAGGAVSAVRSMCMALAERGHDVTLLATDAGVPREERGLYQTRSFPMEFPPLAVSYGFARALGQLGNVDLVHIHQLYRFPQSLTALFCRRHGIPYCIQPHGSLEPILFFKKERRGMKRLYEALIEKRNLQRAAGLIYTAPGERDAVNFLHLRPPAYIVPNGLHLSEFSSDKVGRGFRAKYGLEGKELIAWMGRLTKIKGLDVLLKAFAAVSRERPQAVLSLIGPDTENYGAVLRRLIADLAIPAGKVLFTGMLEGEEKLAALSEADFFIMPSYTENFALAAVEAMALARPVIVSSNVKIAPAIADASAGLVVMPDETDLRVAMLSLLNDAGLRRRMGESARALASSYGWPVVVGELENAYADMIEKAAR